MHPLLPARVDAIDGSLLRRLLVGASGAFCSTRPFGSLWRYGLDRIDYR